MATSAADALVWFLAELLTISGLPDRNFNLRYLGPSTKSERANRSPLHGAFSWFHLLITASSDRNA